MTVSSIPRDGRVLAISGVLCAVVFIGGLLVIGLLIPASAPANLPDTEPAEIQRFFAEHGEMAQAQALIQTASAALLLVFGGVLSGLIRRSEQAAAELSDVTLAGGVLASVCLGTSALLAGTLGVEQIGDSPATVSALRQLSFFVGGAGHTVGLGIMIGAASLGIRRGRLLPNWLTTAGFVSAIVSLLSLLSLVLQPAAAFIPLGRFSGLLVMAAAGLLLMTGRTGLSSRDSRARSTLAGVGVVVLAVVLMIAV